MPIIPWCLPCGEQRRETPARWLVDNDPMCDACKNANMAGAINVIALDSEGRVSPDVTVKRKETPIQPGKEIEIRPRRPAQTPRRPTMPQPQPTPTPPAPVVATVCGVAEDASTETRAALGELARSASAACTAGGFKIVKREELPGVARRESANLNQRVFDAMLAARPEAIEVPVENWKAGVNLRRRLQLIARAKGLAIDWSRTKDSKLFYFWLVEPKATP